MNHTQRQGNALLKQQPTLSDRALLCRELLKRDQIDCAAVSAIEQCLTGQPRPQLGSTVVDCY